MLAMVRIWKPKNTTKKHELDNKFNNSKLLEFSKTSDKWFQTLAGIVIRPKLDFSIHYDNKKVMGYILHNLKPKEYEHTIDSIKRDINHSIPVDLDGVKEDIGERFGEISKQEGFEDKYQEDT
jgi:UDP-galactopyranose mutase